jgi:hypothetical protein
VVRIKHFPEVIALLWKKLATLLNQGTGFAVQCFDGQNVNSPKKCFEFGSSTGSYENP